MRVTVRADPERAPSQGYNFYVDTTDQTVTLTPILQERVEWVVLERATYRFVANVWYTLRLEAEGNQLRFFVDDVAVLTATDELNADGFFYFSVGPGVVAQLNEVRYWRLPE